MVNKLPIRSTDNVHMWFVNFNDVWKEIMVSSLYDDKTFYVHLLRTLKFDRYIYTNSNELELIDNYSKKVSIENKSLDYYENV